jgi:hypothetical protein
MAEQHVGGAGDVLREHVGISGIGAVRFSHLKGRSAFSRHLPDAGGKHRDIHNLAIVSPRPAPSFGCTRDIGGHWCIHRCAPQLAFREERNVPAVW